MATVKVMVVRPCEAPELTTYSSLEDLQSFVGGWIEAINGSRNPDEVFEEWSAYVNEEGKINGLPYNPNATELANRIGWYGRGIDVLCGPVVFLGPVDDEGDSTDVPQWVVEAAQEVPV